MKLKDFEILSEVMKDHLLSVINSLERRGERERKKRIKELDRETERTRESDVEGNSVCISI